MEHKACKKCEETKALEEFYVLKSGHRHIWCKSCCREATNVSRLETKRQDPSFDGFIVGIANISDFHGSDWDLVKRWMAYYGHPRPITRSNRRGRSYAWSLKEVENWARTTNVNCASARRLKGMNT